MSEPIILVSARDFEAMENELIRHRNARYQTELNEEMIRAAKENGAIIEREECARAVDALAETWKSSTLMVDPVQAFKVVANVLRTRADYIEKLKELEGK